MSRGHDIRSVLFTTSFVLNTGKIQSTYCRKRSEFKTCVHLFVRRYRLCCVVQDPWFNIYFPLFGVW